MGLHQSAGIYGKQYIDSMKDSDGNIYSFNGYGPYTWTKHARLHIFMRDAYHRQNQDAKPEKIHYFTKVSLDLEDLKRLEKAINNQFRDYFCNANDGAYFAHQYQEESANDYKEQDIEFVKYAALEIKKGNEIVYDSSW